MSELSFDPALLKAIIFDLDGTLYHQNSLQRAMLVRLLEAHATRPLSGLQTFRVLGAYRRAQERLRDEPTVSSDLAEAQIRLTCEQTKVESGDVVKCVTRWMEQEPLPLLARHLHPGLIEFLRACQARGLRLAVLSDYPADAKLNALGLDGFFDVVLSAQSTEIGVFKPHPRGLLLAAARLGMNSSECVYVGDRAEVDGVAAAAAGMPCFILSARRRPRSNGLWMHVGGYRQLHELLLERSDAQARGVPQLGLNGR
jgi:phosphoglycolate phosphatase/putative hydrolase of the HAD superfamily